MMQGYGVDVVISQLCARLNASGHQVMTICAEADGTYPEVPIVVAAPHASALRVLLKRLAPDVVLIHSAPYFDRLAALKKALPQIKWVVWEHGDPSPELFTRDREARQAERQLKQAQCYPVADAIVTISRFVRRDIGYEPGRQPEALIYNGCDHAPDLGPKTATEITPAGRPLRVGTLARLGPGEAHYKGTAEFIAMVADLRDRGIAITPCFLGRGTPEEAARFTREGFEVHLNASNAQKWQYLRSLDVFVSCSRWEGFNLPLVEAQALGTASLALNIAAHPEVTDNTFADMQALVAQVIRYQADRDSLHHDSVRAYQVTRAKFRWEEAGNRLEQLIAELVGTPFADSTGGWRLSFSTRIAIALGRLRHFIRYRLM
jgi:glycosyltransferase involved in cell wall biosynthesis